MANTLNYKDTTYNIGDTVIVGYKIKEGDKFRVQDFKGIITQVKGIGDGKNFTIRKIGIAGIGVERIIPVNSPHISGIKLVRKTKYSKAKIPFLPTLSVKETNRKLYRSDADQLKMDAVGVAKAEAKKSKVSAAKVKTTKATKADDLVIIEGIGPKIAELLVNASITTFAKLAETSVEDIQKILDEAGSKFSIHTPTTWPQQAALAAEGKMEELEALKAELNAGKEA
jgi:ribosomal protein L19